jgi:hypothetical protein
MSIEARNRSQLAGISPQVEQLPIFGINKDKYLAFRYRRSDNQVSFHIYTNVYSQLTSGTESTSAAETGVCS